MSAATTVVVGADGALAIANIGDAMELWDALRRAYLAVRPVVQDTRSKWTYPQTTIGDVRQILRVWEQAFTRDYKEHGDVSGIREQWRAYHERANAIVAAGNGADVYPDNRDLWLRHTDKLSVRLSQLRVLPSKRAMMLDAIGDAARALPSRLLRASTGGLLTAGGGAVADAAGDALEAAAELASRPVKGFFSGLGTPLLIGAGLLAAIVIVPRVLPRKTDALTPGSNRRGA